ncbi:hypothetical protein PR048_016813 [Dryococelus australis]|uniref:Uncharacterized protein n=1 Tax=Dryococelus australis TaxID=614101 RepID=A0ABQ9H7V0_9NEOP|nr:hypothetical protein PR048_016813 [Dryococelus australis]
MISGDRGKPKSGWSIQQLNLEPPECEPTGLPLRCLAQSVPEFRAVYVLVTAPLLLSEHLAPWSACSNQRRDNTVSELELFALIVYTYSGRNIVARTLVMPPKARHVRFPAGSLPEYCMRESCRTMPMSCFSMTDICIAMANVQKSPSSSLGISHFSRLSIPLMLYTHLTSALKTTLDETSDFPLECRAKPGGGGRGLNKDARATDHKFVRPQSPVARQDGVAAKRDVRHVRVSCTDKQKDGSEEPVNLLISSCFHSSCPSPVPSSTKCSSRAGEDLSFLQAVSLRSSAHPSVREECPLASRPVCMRDRRPGLKGPYYVTLMDRLNAEEFLSLLLVSSSLPDQTLPLPPQSGRRDVVIRPEFAPQRRVARAGLNARSPRKPADQRRHQALFLPGMEPCSPWCEARRDNILRVTGFPAGTRRWQSSLNMKLDPRMEWPWNVRAGETGVPRENPPASGIVRERTRQGSNPDRIGGRRAP